MLKIEDASSLGDVSRFKFKTADIGFLHLNGVGRALWANSGEGSAQ